MGLMQLLALGRSLGRISERQNRYKLARQGLLPKFGIAGADGLVREGESLETPASEVGKKKVVTMDPIRREDAKARTMIMNSTVRSESTTVAAASPSGTTQAFPHGRWSLFKNPFAKTPRTKPPAEPQQSELLLESVKPVRNDLTDSDLEVVAANRPSAGAARTIGEPGSPPSEPEASRLAWDRIKTQFFGAEKV